MIPRYAVIGDRQLHEALDRAETLLELHQATHNDPKCPFEIATKQEIARIKLELLRRRSQEQLPQRLSVAFEFDELGDLLALATLGGMVMASQLTKDPEKKLQIMELTAQMVQQHLSWVDDKRLRLDEELVNRTQQTYLQLLARTAEEYDAG